MSSSRLELVLQVSSSSRPVTAVPLTSSLQAVMQTNSSTGNSHLLTAQHETEEAAPGTLKTGMLTVEGKVQGTDSVKGRSSGKRYRAVERNSCSGQAVGVTAEAVNQSTTAACLNAACMNDCHSSQILYHRMSISNHLPYRRSITFQMKSLEDSLWKSQTFSTM